jgi:hypothetical protein
MTGWVLVAILVEGNVACLVASGLVPVFHPEFAYLDFFNLKPPRWRFFLLWGALVFSLIATNLIYATIALSLRPESVGVLGLAILNLVGPFAFVSLVHYVREVLRIRRHQKRSLAAVQIIFAQLRNDGKVTNEDVRNLVEVLKEHGFFTDNDDYNDLLAVYRR